MPSVSQWWKGHSNPHHHTLRSSSSDSAHLCILSFHSQHQSWSEIEDSSQLLNSFQENIWVRLADEDVELAITLHKIGRDLGEAAQVYYVNSEMFGLVVSIVLVDDDTVERTVARDF